MAQVEPLLLKHRPDDFLLTSKEVAMICRVSVGTINSHRYAGLLPYVPGRPIKMRVGDVKVYRALIERHGKKIHRSLRIAPDYRRVYSPLHSVANFTDRDTSQVIAAVIRETDGLWQDREKPKSKKRAKAA